MGDAAHIILPDEAEVIELGSRRPVVRQNRGRVSGKGGGATAPVSFTPASVTSANKRFWHDAQDNATITIATGVSTWLDKFGNGYDMGQATGGKQPTVVTDAFGGRQSLRFTSASVQTMFLTDAAKVTAAVGGTSVAYELWLVAQLNSVTGVHEIVSFESSTVATEYSLHITNGALWQYERRDGVGADVLRTQSGAVPATATPYVLRCGYDGTNANWVVNGTTLTTAGSSATGQLDVDRLRYSSIRETAATFFEGWLGEAICFTGTLSAGEATSLTDYLKAKWGISF